ncbi:MAG: DNA polymerase III subunit delta' [Bryobacterales bacterium]|nr:DNA polymerase III subunit delta' [Bryobacteraceae bacterium]MDW8355738.1 DNA polymerase III subunit delta' [Bryobacterales bacterium]
MFERFFGNERVVTALERMIAHDRIPHTLLFAGPAGVGKATLARRFAARLLGGADRIEQDDLSLPHNAARIAERDKWPAERRNEEPLLFASHPDFVTFAPDGPLRQITIAQMRFLREQAQFKPLEGARRIFLVDQVDRANEPAANSLLKTLEEPPEHLILVMTAENPYDLLPTVRSRAVLLWLGPLSDDEMARFVKERGLDQPERRIALADGRPGVAVALDLAEYDRRRQAMLGLLEAAAGASGFGDWLERSEALLGRGEQFEFALRVLLGLLEDLLILHAGGGRIRNFDCRAELEHLAARVSFDWLRAAVARTDELLDLLRRNIQRTIALDAMVLQLRQIPGVRASSANG